MLQFPPQKGKPNQNAISAGSVCKGNTNNIMEKEEERKRQEWGGGGSMKKLCVMNAPAIIRHSVTMTLVVDAILDSNFKTIPLIPCSLPRSTLWRNLNRVSIAA